MKNKKKSSSRSRKSTIQFIEPNRFHDKLKKMIVDKALCLKGKEHFLNSQGVQGSFLFDFRPLLMDPIFLNLVVDIFWKHYKSYKKVQIVSLELGSLTLLGAIIHKAKELNIDATGVFVRKSRKKSGRQKVIEGDLTDAPIIAIDDLINSGSSINKMVLALKDEGRDISECFAIMTYNDSGLKQFLTENKMKASFLFSLSDFSLKKSNSLKNDLRTYNVMTNVFEFRPKEELYKALLVGPRSNVTLDSDLDQLYYGTNSGKVYCISAIDGKFIWDFTMKHAHAKGIQSTPTLSRGKLYFGGYDGNLYSLDARTGKCLWTANQADYIHSSPAIDEDLGLLFIGLEINHPQEKGAIAAYNIETGELVWSYSVKEYLPCNPSYSKKLNLIAIGTNDSFLLLLNAKTGEKIWSFQAKAEIKAAPVFYDNDTFVAASSHDGNVYGIEVKTGKLTWMFRTDSGLYSPPIAYKNIIAFGSTDKCIYILDLIKRESVAVIPTHGRIFSTPSLINDKIFFGNNNGQVIEIDPETSRVESVHQLPDRVCSAITYSKKFDLFYTHVSDDRVFAFRKIKIRDKIRAVNKEIKTVQDLNAIRRSPSTMTRHYADGSVGINTVLKTESYFKIDGVKAKVWKLIDGSSSIKAIAKKIAKEEKLPLVEVNQYLPETLNEFLQNGFIEKFDV